MRNYHNIERRAVRTGPYPATEYPYRGYSNRIGTDSVFLIRRSSNGKRWSAYGMREDKPAGSYLHADTLAELSIMLEQLK